MKMKNSTKIAIIFIILISIFILIQVLCFISKDMYNSCIEEKGLTNCFIIFCDHSCQTPFYDITHIAWILMLFSLNFLTPVFIFCFVYEKNKEKKEKKIDNKQ